MNQSIKDKIQELFTSTPSDVSVGYGKKITNGEFTGEIGIIFNVEKKKPLNEISENEILPTSVEIDGVTYITDVFERGKLLALSCNQEVLDGCYGWQTTTPINQTHIRPLKGGTQISSDTAATGTLGFIAVDNLTNALVAITNNHVSIVNGFYSTERDVYNEQNEINNPIYQPGNATTTIGSVIRYSPLKSPGNDVFNPIFNYVDGAVISVNSSDISFTESFKQQGLPYNLPMAFATTSEIDNLLTTNPPIYSSGRTTGAKFGACGLTIQSIHSTASVYPYTNGTNTNVTLVFGDLIDYIRINPDCEWPIKAGDSGSALIADFNGTCKIIGLAFAGGSNAGAACRIDRVAQELNISAWDGSTKPFINLSSKTTITTTGSSSNKTIECGGKTYWQVGKTPYSNPCV